MNIKDKTQQQTLDLKKNIANILEKWIQINLIDDEKTTLNVGLDVLHAVSLGLAVTFLDWIFTAFPENATFYFDKYIENLTTHFEELKNEKTRILN